MYNTQNVFQCLVEQVTYGSSHILEMFTGEMEESSEIIIIYVSEPSVRLLAC